MSPIALSWFMSLLFKDQPVIDETSPEPRARISEDRHRVEVVLTWPGSARIIDPGINGQIERSIFSPPRNFIALIGQQPSGEKGRYNTWVTWHDTKTGQRIGHRENLAIHEVILLKWISIDGLLILIVAGRTGKVAEKTPPEMRVYAFRVDKPSLQANDYFENCSHIEEVELTQYPTQPLLRCTCLNPSGQQSYRVISLMRLLNQ